MMHRQPRFVLLCSTIPSTSLWTTDTLIKLNIEVQIAMTQYMSDALTTSVAGDTHTVADIPCSYHELFGGVVDAGWLKPQKLRNITRYALVEELRHLSVHPGVVAIVEALKEVIREAWVENRRRPQRKSKVKIGGYKEESDDIDDDEVGEEGGGDQPETRETTEDEGDDDLENSCDQNQDQDSDDEGETHSGDSSEWSDPSNQSFPVSPTPVFRHRRHYEHTSPLSSSAIADRILTSTLPPILGLVRQTTPFNDISYRPMSSSSSSVLSSATTLRSEPITEHLMHTFNALLVITHNALTDMRTGPHTQMPQLESTRDHHLLRAETLLGSFQSIADGYIAVLTSQATFLPHAQGVLCVLEAKAGRNTEDLAAASQAVSEMLAVALTRQADDKQDVWVGAMCARRTEVRMMAATFRAQYLTALRGSNARRRESLNESALVWCWPWRDLQFDEGRRLAWEEGLALLRDAQREAEKIANTRPSDFV